MINTKGPFKVLHGDSGQTFDKTRKNKLVCNNTIIAVQNTADVFCFNNRNHLEDKQLYSEIVFSCY